MYWAGLRVLAENKRLCIISQCGRHSHSAYLGGLGLIERADTHIRIVSAGLHLMYFFRLVALHTEVGHGTSYELMVWLLPFVGLPALSTLTLLVVVGTEVSHCWHQQSV